MLLSDGVKQAYPYIIYSFFCFAISVEMVEGMDQIQEGISLGPS